MRGTFLIKPWARRRRIRRVTWPECRRVVSGLGNAKANRAVHGEWDVLGPVYPVAAPAALDLPGHGARGGVKVTGADDSCCCIDLAVASVTRRESPPVSRFARGDEMSGSRTGPAGREPSILRVTQCPSQSAGCKSDIRAFGRSAPNRRQSETPPPRLRPLGLAGQR